MSNPIKEKQKLQKINWDSFLRLSLFLPLSAFFLSLPSLLPLCKEEKGGNSLRHSGKGQTQSPNNLFSYYIYSELLLFVILLWKVRKQGRRMLVANSFDLWQKDTFFSAAEEVQQSADTWVRLCIISNFFSRQFILLFLYCPFFYWSGFRLSCWFLYCIL